MFRLQDHGKILNTSGESSALGRSAEPSGVLAEGSMARDKQPKRCYWSYLSLDELPSLGYPLYVLFVLGCFLSIGASGTGINDLNWSLSI